MHVDDARAAAIIAIPIAAMAPWPSSDRDDPCGLLAVSQPRHLLPAANRQVLTGRQFFPHLISAPFHQGLTVVFAVATGLAVLAALASLLRGGRYVHPEAAAESPRSRLALQ